MARNINRPAPIDCMMGRWNPWTPCNDCTDIQYRFRPLEKPSQFGGTACGDLWERRQCPAPRAQCMVPDYCEETFTCAESGRCISQSLRCNGEDDCVDGSDEANCETVNRRNDKCSTLMSIPGADRGTQGYNILTGEFMDYVLDYKYYGGKCEYVYNGDWRKFTYESFCENLGFNDLDKNYRKPYNYHTYRFVAQARSEGSHEYYEDMASMLKARETFNSANGGVTIGISLVEFGASGKTEEKFLKNITRYQSQDKGYIRLWSKVQTAHFKMRSSKLMLHEDFYTALMDLPEQYDFGMYYRFFDQYGTHYVTEGTMGGSLEYVAVINKTAMAESEINAEETELCLGASIGLGKTFSGVFVGGKLSPRHCGKGGSYSEDRDADSSLIEDIITLVKGGNLYSTSGVLAIQNPETYRKWGTSLKYNPTVIEYEIMPIHELVRLSTAADHVGERLANLQKGMDEYTREFNPCRCAPCKHDGVPVFSGASCSCICKSGFFGQACEQTHRGDVKTDGSWSCWAAWSECASTSQTRRRTCNNPAPEKGGANCVGSSSQTRRC